MKNQSESKIVPAQRTGKEIIVTASVTFRSPEEAQKFFETAKNRLRNVNEWSSLTGNLSADFCLHDAKGNRVNRSLKKVIYSE